MPLRLSDDQVRLLRARSQRLLSSRDLPAQTPAQVLHAVCGVQAQDLPSALLSLRARSPGLTAGQVTQAIANRAAVRVWCMRGTLHLVTAQDALWLIPLYASALITGDRRRLEELGWDAASAGRGIGLLQIALEERDALTRAEIRDLLRENRLPWEGQAPVHLIFRAALEGVLCFGADRGKEPTFASFEAWLGKPEPLPRTESLQRLAFRYLEAYAPAALEDFASWSGLKMNEAREAWQGLNGQAVQVLVQDRPGWMFRSQIGWLEQPANLPAHVRLLPRYDTYLLGYSNRDMVVDPLYARHVHPGGGQISAVLMVDGRAAGTWTTRRYKGSLEIRVRPFNRLDEALIPGLQAEVEDLGRFLGDKAVLIVEKTEL